MPGEGGAGEGGHRQHRGHSQTTRIRLAIPEQLNDTKYKFLQVKNSFITILNGRSVLKLFQLSNGDLLFSYNAYSIYKVHKTRMTKLGQGVEVRAHYTLY